MRWVADQITSNLIPSQSASADSPQAVNRSRLGTREYLDDESTSENRLQSALPTQQGRFVCLRCCQFLRASALWAQRLSDTGVPQAPAANVAPVDATASRAVADQPTQTGASETPGKGALLLDVGDVLDVRVFDTPELSGKFRVDRHGDITLPVGGTVQVKGLTAEAGADRDRTAFSATRDFARSPRRGFRAGVRDPGRYRDGRGQNARSLSHPRETQCAGLHLGCGRAYFLRFEDAFS